ncbi:MAG: hypothetical protein WAU00_06630 [Caldilinea sp.]
MHQRLLDFRHQPGHADRLLQPGDDACFLRFPLTGPRWVAAENESPERRAMTTQRVVQVDPAYTGAYWLRSEKARWERCRKDADNAVGSHPTLDARLCAAKASS